MSPRTVARPLPNPLPEVGELIMRSPTLGLPIALMTSQIVDRMLERREAANRDAYERRLTTAPLSPAQASQERILIEMKNLRAWREAKDVYIDPAHGDDRNDGLDEATPIKTMNEARRRWNGCNPDTFGYMHGRPFT